MLITPAPRGTNDYLPQEAGILLYIEDAMRCVASSFGYDELRLPLFEHTELFQRGIGEATDVVEKEMYTFDDRSGRSITLRPEGTASVVRAYLENKLYSCAQPVKLMYSGPMFRYERPQAGRYRQFTQLGLEAIGSALPHVDAEIIAMCATFYARLGLVDYSVNLNTIGCPECRPRYLTELKEFTKGSVQSMCNSCKSRFERNPLRLLDCKVDECRRLTESAPRSVDCLCAECTKHFDALTAHLSDLGIAYTLNNRLVRGLDYYTKTVFEFTLQGIGSQDAIGGGGRYDGLVEQVGGEPTPAVGVAIGVERISLAMKQIGVPLPNLLKASVYIAVLGPEATREGFKLANRLRVAGLRTEMDYLNKSLKAQFKAADKHGAVLCVVIGDEELARGVGVLRFMADGQQRDVRLEELADEISTVFMADSHHRRSR